MYNSSSDVVAIVFAVLGILLLYSALMAMLVITYIISAKAQYQLSSRRGIANPWMAWVPGLNMWNLGCLANEYDSRLGMKRKWNLLLVILQGISMAIYSTYSAVYSVTIFPISFNSSYYSYEYMPEDIIVPAIIILCILILAMIAASALSMVQYICFFKIFESTLPEKAVKYLILSILVPMAYAFCLRNCADKGYPFLETEPSCQESVITE